MKHVGRTAFLLLFLIFVPRAWRLQAQATPPPAPPTPTQTQTPAPAPQTSVPPVKPASSEEAYETSDGQFSIRLMYWVNRTHPELKTGHAAIVNTSSNVSFYGDNKPSPGAELSFPAGKHNTIRVSYFRTQAHGNGYAGSIPSYQTYFVWSSTFNPGDYLATSYTLQNAKISLDYLSWPFPVNNARFRVKTLWEVQYTNVRSSVSAPLNPTTDVNGNAVQTSGTGTNWFIWPSFGMGIEYMVSKHFRFEARASGFAIPHFSALYDLDGFFAYRAGPWEIDFGGRDFYFHTSPRREEYVRASLPGGYVALRFFLK